MHLRGDRAPGLGDRPVQHGRSERGRWEVNVLEEKKEAAPAESEQGQAREERLHNER